MLLAALAPLAACGLFQAALNVYRFGNVLEFGYGSEPATGFTTPLPDGIGYLLLSPGKGLFLFAPPVLLGLALWPRLARRRPLEAMVVALVFLGQLLYFARWWAWHGDWSWGPRYMVVTVPFVMLAWGLLFDGWRRTAAPLKAAAAALAGAGLLVSLLGVAIHYGAYYSVLSFQLGRGPDVNEARLTWEFSPLRGHAWLAKASFYDAFAGSSQTGARTSAAGARQKSNPFLRDYPWAASHPELYPEAPEREVGYDFWFASLKDRPPFLEYWSGLVAAWLALSLLPLGRRLWTAASASSGLSLTRATWPSAG